MMNCKQCGTELSLDTSDEVNGRTITCPECHTVLPVDKSPVNFTPSSRKLPAQMSVKMVFDDLVITRHNRSLPRLGLFAITSFLLGFGAFFSDLHIFEFWVNPLTWMVFGLWYYGLTGLVNRSEVRVNSEQLEVKRGPLLWWRRFTIDADDVKQLYITEEGKQSKNSSITYELHLQTNQGHRDIVTGLDSVEQALFLEQEIERYLGIEDEFVSEELPIDYSENFDGWQQFAQVNGLRFTSGKLRTGYQVAGQYQGFDIELLVLDEGLIETYRTRLIARVAEKGGESQELAEKFDLDDVISLFDAYKQQGQVLRGEFKANTDHGVFSYEASKVRTDSVYLQLALDMLVQIAERYPHMSKLGGATIPLLSPIARDNKHPAQRIAAQLIKEIAPTTKYLDRPEADSVLCPDCLVRQGTHQIELGWFDGETYYGCRQCHRSLALWDVNWVAAILDQTSEKAMTFANQILKVNALLRSDLFDFDAVAIVDASDEAVERFVVKVRNDTDPVRKKKYGQIRCNISPTCELSENTLRILRQTFADVEVRTVDGMDSSQIEDHQAVYRRGQDDDLIEIDRGIDQT